MSHEPSAPVYALTAGDVEDYLDEAAGYLLAVELLEPGQKALDLLDEADRLIQGLRRDAWDTPRMASVADCVEAVREDVLRARCRCGAWCCHVQHGVDA